MSTASETFAESILDAENLLAHFNALNTLPPPPEAEVLKRAGLVMAMTAWETYVEDRLEEACSERLLEVTNRSIANFVESKLTDEIKRLNNPNSQKTIELFREYADVDLRESWCWNNFDSTTVRRKLDGYLKLRGDVVHRSRPIPKDRPVVHPVKKGELEKAISFLRNLVAATERGFEASAQPTQNAVAGERK